jgi:hypothetical protein
LLVDMLTARMPKAKIAAFLHIDVRTLTAFMHRLSAAADAPYPEPPPLPPPREGAPASRVSFGDAVLAVAPNAKRC